MKKILFVFGCLILSLSLVGVANAQVGFTAPASTAPACNPLIDGYGCYTPLNVGSISQTKDGPLTVLGQFTVGTSSVSAGANLFGNLNLFGTFQFVDGNQAAGKVLISNGNGTAYWGTTSCAVNTAYGACGLSNGGTFTVAPINNLCLAGTASGVTGSGPWAWTCTGASGGTVANCSAGVSSAIGSVPASPVRWAAPKSVAPACDPLLDYSCYTPLNVGAFLQTKAGSLSVLDQFTAGSSAAPISAFVWGRLNLAGTFQFVDGNQSTGRLLMSHADGTAYWGTTTCAAGPTNGICGAANTGNYVTAPATNLLCLVGTPTGVSHGASWTWSCLGANGGTDASCSASITVLVAGDGVCGNYLSCLVGTVSNTITFGGMGGSATWQCDGTNGGRTAFCSYYPPVVTADGVCGSDNGQTIDYVSNYCSVGGVSSVVTTSSGWTWNCDGSGDGKSVSCSANKAPAVNGTCGSANGTYRSSAPTTNLLCLTGTAGSVVSNTSGWSWWCNGSHGGNSASCSSNKLIRNIVGIKVCDCPLAPGYQVCAGNETLIGWVVTSTSNKSLGAIAYNGGYTGLQTHMRGSPYFVYGPYIWTMEGDECINTDPAGCSQWVKGTATCRPN